MRWRDAYWGKARPVTGSGRSWHPLAWHSLDVAAAMWALLAARPAWSATLSRLTGLPDAEVQKRLILVAALHDLGKFADNFQAKVPDLYQALNGGGRVFADSSGHGDIGAELWDVCTSPYRSQLDLWVKAAFSHHGVPVRAARQDYLDALSSRSLSDGLAFVEQVFDLIGQPEGPDGKEGLWLVSGLVILADWLGSNQAWFPYHDPDISPQAYWDGAKARATKAVSEAKLAEAQTATGFDLTALLGNAVEATPLQDWAQAQAPTGGGHLYIIEDLTGAGKTEAALILAHRLMASGAAEGLYWALPTMATANGLYARLQGRYRQLFQSSGDPAQSPSLILTHGAADINPAFQASVTHGEPLRSTPPVEAEQEITAEAYCADFFAQDHKKALLAQVGVGTLDQALLGILPVRHQSLRLAALSRRVLVIDEAHSFDAYTGRLMERLLRFHAHHGGSAIILSATLSQSLRQAMIKAYCPAAEVDGLSSAFPLITHVSQDALEEDAVAPSRGSRRDLPIKTFEALKPVLEALLERAKAGGCGVYIRNTVEDARTAFEALKAMAPADVQIHLFHARFTGGDRARIEAEALARFGVDSQPEDRRGRILVATQVVESSLDLDFDVMASDLCPMDLLIQRAGRLQRHGHRPERPAPELWLLAPGADQALDGQWYGTLFPKGQYVYPDLGQLWRTFEVLKREQGLNLRRTSPRAYIEPVFGPEPLDTPELVMTASDPAVGQRISGRALASLNALDPKRFQPWERQVRTPTRLGEDTRPVRLARWCDGHLAPWAEAADPDEAWRLSEISIEVRKIASSLAPCGAAQAVMEQVQARWAGRYDPPLILILERQDGQEDAVSETADPPPGRWHGRALDPRGHACLFLYDPVLGLDMLNPQS